MTEALRKDRVTLSSPEAHWSRPRTRPEWTMTDNCDPYVISIPQAAERLGISKDLAYDLARRGQLPGAIQLGRPWRVSLIRLNTALHGPENSEREQAG